MPSTSTNTQPVNRAQRRSHFKFRRDRQFHLMGKEQCRAAYEMRGLIKPAKRA